MNVALCEQIETIMRDSYINREEPQETAARIKKLDLAPMSILDYLQYNDAQDRLYPDRDAVVEALRDQRDKETGYESSTNS